MKWYIGIQAQIVTLVIGSAILYYLQDNDMSIPADDTNVALLFVFIIAFIGGFMAPYNVGRTARYGSTAYTIIIGIPIILILYAVGEINNDTNSDFGAVIVLIILLALAIALGISIVVVAVLLFVGGFIGAIFGRMFFKPHQYDPVSPKG